MPLGRRPPERRRILKSYADYYNGVRTHLCAGFPPGSANRCDQFTCHAGRTSSALRPRSRPPARRPNEIGNRQTTRSFGHIIRQQRRGHKRLPSGPPSRFNLLSRRGSCTKSDICDLPSSERAIKIDEIRRDLRVAVGKIIFALEQLGLCRDDIQDRTRPRLGVQTRSPKWRL